MASTYLTKAADNAANQNIFTLSAWLKPASSAFNGAFLSFAESSVRYVRMFFESGKLCIKQAYDGSTEADTKTTALYKDNSSWYHVVIAVDSTQAVSTDRIKMYVNGEQITSFSSVDYGAINTDFVTRTTCYVGQSGNSDNYFDGLMSQVIYIDGTQYAASTFGSTDSTSGEWKPNADPSVTYGSTGFKLTFEDTSALGDDTSGNTNDLTMSGSGTPTLDCPSNNFGVLTNQTYHFANQWQANTNGATTANGGSGSAWKTILPTLGDSSGKYYFEAKLISSGSNCIIGAVDIDNQKQNSSSSWYIGQDSTGQGYQNNGTASNGGASYGTSYVNNDIIGVAMDLDNSKIYFSKNGTWQESGDPTSGASGTGALSLTANTTYTFALSSYAGTVWNCNFGNGYFATTAVTSAGTSASTPGTFEYDVPTGYQPLTTKGLNV
tara:strand:- start:4022 stop:5332 length:1311 start_codon:yes stop_codon:yes gene_type:complete